MTWKDITLALILLMAAYVAYPFFTPAIITSPAWAKTAHDLWEIQIGLENFKSDHGSYPPGDTWRQELIGAPDAQFNTQPYPYV